MKKFYLLSAVLLFSAISCLAQPFTLDQTFGFGGKVYTNLVDINKSDEQATAVAVQADGKIVVAGTTISPTAVLRYNIDGTLDNSFGRNGMTFCYGFTLNTIAIQTDGRILVGGVRNNDFALIRFNVDGSLDNSFDGDGQLTTAIGASTDIVTCLALQADGQIVAAGHSHNGVNYDFAVARYNINGSPDNSFDGDGKMTLALGASDETISAIYIQPDGKILVGGNCHNGTAYDFGLARINTDGTPDNGFDGDGKVITDISSADEYIRSIRTGADGKIFVAGTGKNGTTDNHPNIIICRYNSGGSLDNSFDGDGKLYMANSFLQRITSAAILSDGKVMYAGTSYGVSYYDFAMARFNSDGSSDNSFDGDGQLVTSVVSNYDRINSIAIQSDGKFVAVGQCEFTGGVWEDFAVARYNSDGTPDNSFSGDGKTVTDISSSDDYGKCMAVQSDGKTIVAGFSYTTITSSTTAGRKFTLVRYNTDGTLDNSFGAGGRVVTDYSSESDIQSIAVLNDGKILVAGTVTEVDYNFALARYNSDGTLDNSFDGDGKFSVSMVARQDIAKAMVVQPDGKIIVIGTAREGITNNYDFGIIRVNANGGLDNSFDGDGMVIVPILPGETNDVGSAVTLQPDGKILVAGYGQTGTGYDFTVVRLNSNGTLDNTFDGDGIVTTDLNGSRHDFPTSIAVQPDGKIVVAGYMRVGSSTTNNDIALVRYNPDGSLDNSFSGDGKIVTDLYGTDDVLNAITILSNGKILTAGYSRNSISSDFALIRLNGDGSFDNTMDGDGIALYDLEGGSSETCYAMELRENRIYLAGRIATAGRGDFVIAAILNDFVSGSLPLHLLDFSGKRVNEDGQLTWKTDNESNMQEYVVERSTDGRTYSAIGTIAAANRTSVNYYNFTDRNIISFNVPVIYYRLKQKGSDGNFTYSRIVALGVDKNKNMVLLYPNPVINEINLALSVSRQDKLQVRIIDNIGQVMKQQQWNVSAGSTSLTIDVSKLAAGMYYLEIKGESIDYKKQFIK